MAQKMEAVNHCCRRQTWRCDPVMVAGVQDLAGAIRVGDSLPSAHDVREVVPALDCYRLPTLPRLGQGVTGAPRFVGGEHGVGMTR